MSYLNNCRSFIKSRESDYLDLLKELAQINTHSYNTDGLHKCLEVIKKYFLFDRSQQIIHQLNPFSTTTDDGQTVHHMLGKALEISSIPDSSRVESKSILLAGHYDTVFHPNSAFQTCTWKDKNTLIGPGVADMKGGLVVLLAGLEAFEKHFEGKKISWKILITPDEEIGSPSSKELYKNIASSISHAFIYEPAFADGSFVDTRGGSSNLSLVIRGRSAHAGRDFDKGKSALLAFSPILSALADLPNIISEIVGAKVTINVGKVHSGKAHNIVPDLCVARINIRSTMPQGIELAKKSIYDLVHNFGYSSDKDAEGISMQIIDEGTRSPKPQDENQAKAHSLLKKCCSEIGIETKTRMSYGVTDGNDLAAFGIPTLDSLGVIGGGLHTDEEYMIIDSLSERALLTSSLLQQVSKDKLSQSSFIEEITK